MIFAGLAKKKDYKANISPEEQEIITIKVRLCYLEHYVQVWHGHINVRLEVAGLVDVKSLRVQFDQKLILIMCLIQQMLHRVTYWHVNQHLRQILRSL